MHYSLCFILISNLRIFSIFLCKLFLQRKKWEKKVKVFIIFVRNYFLLLALIQSFPDM